MLITVFTPVYNRATLVGKLYHSLCEQTFTNFEWIIIDDKSTDNSLSIIKSFKKTFFDIVIIENEVNGGKHRALNKAVEFARGDYFFVVDSDDCLPADALENLSKMIKTTKGDDNIVGVAGVKTFFSGKNVSVIDTKGKEYVDVPYLYAYENGIRGDCAEIFKTQLLKKIKYPEIIGERFIPESFVYNQLSNRNKLLRYFNISIYLCNYLDDGLTKNHSKIIRQNPRGYAMSIEQIIKMKKMKFFERWSRRYLFYRNISSEYNMREVSSFLGIGYLKFVFSISFISIVYMLFLSRRN